MKNIFIMLGVILSFLPVSAFTNNVSTNQTVNPNLVSYNEKYNKKYLPAWYIGGGFSFNSKINWNYQDDFDSNESFYSYNIITGYSFTKFFALEAEFNYGNPTYKVEGISYNNDFFSTYLNAVFQYPIKEKHIPFVKIGFGYADYKLHSSYVTWEANDFSYHFTLGYEYDFTNKHAIIISYNYYLLPNYRLDFHTDLPINCTPTDNACIDHNANWSTFLLQYKFSLR